MLSWATGPLQQLATVAHGCGNVMRRPGTGAAPRSPLVHTYAQRYVVARHKMRGGTQVSGAPPALRDHRQEVHRTLGSNDRRCPMSWRHHSRIAVGSVLLFAGLALALAGAFGPSPQPTAAAISGNSSSGGHRSLCRRPVGSGISSRWSLVMLMSRVRVIPVNRYRPRGR
jgi:hypothetical protein